MGDQESLAEGNKPSESENIFDYLANDIISSAINEPTEVSSSENDRIVDENHQMLVETAGKTTEDEFVSETTKTNLEVGINSNDGIIDTLLDDLNKAAENNKVDNE